MTPLYRTYKKDRTDGFMLLPDGERMPTLEPPWINNKKNESCIPEGQYRVVRNKTGKYQWYEITDVPNRTNIELHEGYKPSHSDGCILTTPECLEKLLHWYGDDDWYLDIKELV